jgi:hypothetical protein
MVVEPATARTAAEQVSETFVDGSGHVSFLTRNASLSP